MSHGVHDHTSLLRLVEALYDLPALTARDANADALLDMFDFACAPAPIAAAPAAGVAGCTGVTVSRLEIISIPITWASAHCA